MKNSTKKNLLKQVKSNKAKTKKKKVMSDKAYMKLIEQQKKKVSKFKYNVRKDKTMKKCHNFCKNDYVVEMAKEYKKFPDAEKLGDMFKSNIKKQIKRLKQNILEAKKKGDKNAEEGYKNVIKSIQKDMLEKKKDPYSCKEKYCNTNCEKVYDFNGNIERQAKFRKTLRKKNIGFSKKYSIKEIEMFKKKGALSGCTKAERSILTPYTYNVFHK